MNQNRSGIHVSVILVSYNTRAMTMDAIDSLYNSESGSSVSFEVIVVDNNSHDGSADAVEKAFPDVRVVRSGENLGFGRGNNLGAEYAQGDALFFLNTDTLVGLRSTERLYNYLNSASKRAVAGACLLNPDGSIQPAIKTFPTVWRIFCEFFWLDRTGLPVFSGPYDNSADPLSEGDIEVAHGAAMMVRRRVFEELGGFDPRFFMYYEECDLCRRIRDAGYSVGYTPSARITHFEGASSWETPWWFFRAMRESRTIYARKHFNVLGQVITQAIVHAGYAVRILVFGCAGLFNRRLRTLGASMFLSYVRRGGPSRE